MGVTIDSSGKKLPNAAETLRITPLMIIALMTGLTVLTCVALAMGPISPTTTPGSSPGAAKPPLPETALYVFLGALGVGCVLAYFVQSGMCVKKSKELWNARTSDDEGHDAVARALMTTTILKAALVEGPGLFGAVLILLTGSLIGLAAPIVALLLLAVMLPARSRLESLMAECKM
ncbi:MAG: hypothetical protein AABZ53_14385 [Planctomycetota bacterium]